MSMPSAGYSQRVPAATATLPWPPRHGHTGEGVLPGATSARSPLCPNDFIPWFCQSRGPGLSIPKLVATLQEDRSLEALHFAMSRSDAISKDIWDEDWPMGLGALFWSLQLIWALL